jgi:hypothetical protein
VVNKNTQAYRLGSLFSTAHEQVFTLIAEDIISGENNGAVTALADKLDAMGKLGEQYKDLLRTDDPIKFNYILSNAVLDILFDETPAVEV